MTLYQRASDPDFLVWIVCVAVLATAIYILVIINDGTTEEQRKLSKQPITVIAKIFALTLPMSYSGAVVVISRYNFLSRLE